MVSLSSFNNAVVSNCSELMLLTVAFIGEGFHFATSGFGATGFECLFKVVGVTTRRFHAKVTHNRFPFFTMRFGHGIILTLNEVCEFVDNGSLNVFFAIVCEGGGMEAHFEEVGVGVGNCLTTQSNGIQIIFDLNVRDTTSIDFLSLSLKHFNFLQNHCFHSIKVFHVVSLSFCVFVQRENSISKGLS